MKTPKENREEIRNLSIAVQVNKQEKKEISKDAELTGLPLSSYARMVLLGKLTVNRGE